MAPSDLNKSSSRHSDRLTLKQQTLGFTSSKRTVSSGGAKNKVARQVPPPLRLTPPSARSHNSSESEGNTDEDRSAHMPVVRELLDPSSERWDKAYGEARAKMGDLPPVHAEKQTKVHHILRVFDMSYEYGPCVGVTRLQRWKRAHALGLSPPQEVYDILVTREGTESFELAQCVFYEAEAEA